MELEQDMKIAIKEAEASLREGNNGFGAVIVRDGKIIASSHDKEDTQNDPTSHAEMNVIRQASKKIGKKLSGCILVSTHEPCPMCASAIVWSGITDIAYGYSIKEAILQGRKRLNFSCIKIFNRSEVDIKVCAGILQIECSVLYREDVRKEIDHLRNTDDSVLGALNEIVFHSMNFCPTLEACKILKLDTRHVCKRLNESSTDTLIKQIDCRLSFSRNYNKLRPYTEYCEEMISLSKDDQTGNDLLF